jgi:flagellar motility protein MotE (MotC chaperone)
VAFESVVPTELFITKQGTILGPKGTESILSMNLLVEELGYCFSWKEGKLEVSKDGESLPVEIKGGTPSLPNEVCLRLIKEIEDSKRFKQEGRVKTVKVQNKDDDFKVQDL